MSSIMFPRINVPMFILSLCFSVILPNLALANTSESLLQSRDTLSRLQQLSEIEQLSYGDSRQFVEDYRRKADKARIDLQQAEQDVETKQRQHADLLSGEQTPERLRQLKLSSHALRMSKRGAKSRSRRLLRIEGKLAQAITAQASLKSKAAQANARVSRQKDKLASLQEGINKASAAALVGKKITAPISKATPISKPKATPEPTPAPALIVAATPEAGHRVKKVASRLESSKVKTLQTVAINKPVVKTPPVKQANLKEQKPNSRKQEALDNANLREAVKAAAVRESKRAEAALASKDKGRQVHKKLQIKGEGFSEGDFEFLGAHQYRAQVHVTHGVQSFIVGSHRYRATVPLSDDGELYVFLYDVSRVGRPRLSMYRKSLVE